MELIVMYHVKLNRIPKSWKEENILSAQKIYEEQKNPIVFFSGGMDSNVVAESFRLAKVPHEIFIMRYNNGWNDYDIKYAIDWCEAYNVKYTLYDADVLSFWRGIDWYNIAIESRLTSPQQIYYLYVATEKVDGYPIFGYGEPDLTREYPSGEVTGLYVKQYYSYKKYFENRSGEGIFFHHTPEQELSWYLEEETIKFVNGVKYTEDGDNFSSDYVDGFVNCLQCHKNDFYKSFYPNLIKRKPIINYNEHPRSGRKRRFGKPMTDYTGFDKLPINVFNLEHKIKDYLKSIINQFEDDIFFYHKYVQDSLTPKFKDYYDVVMEKVNDI